MLLKHKDWRPYCRSLLSMSILQKYATFFTYSCFIYYVKIFFFLLVVLREKSLIFHGRDVDFADGILFLDSYSFYDIIMSYIFQQLWFDIRVQQLCLQKHLFLRKTKFQSDNFQNSPSIIKSSFLKLFWETHIYLCWF